MISLNKIPKFLFYRIFEYNFSLDHKDVLIAFFRIVSESEPLHHYSFVQLPVSHI